MSAHIPTAWIDAASGNGVTDRGAALTLPIDPAAGGLLARVPAAGSRLRLYVIGEPAGGWVPWLAETLRAAPLWTTATRGHHVTDNPVFRFKQKQTSQELELRSAGEWFGAGAYSPADARAATDLLGRELGRRFGSGGFLLGSPATTGRHLARIAGGLHEPLSADVRELIGTFAYQGRRHILETRRRRLPGFVYVDARIAYGACTRELGAGVAYHDNVPELPLDARGRLTARGWLRVRVRIPADWSHAGLLALVPGPRPIEYPAEPGRVFECWANTAEVAIALEHGWHIAVFERLILDQSKPLDLWRERLEAIWQGCMSPPARDGLSDVSPTVRGLVAGAVGRIVREGIGAFAHRGVTVTRLHATLADVPAGVAFDELDGGAIRTTERIAPDERLAHPELAAQIWGRARARLLKAPGGAGALSVPRDRLLAFRTDAVWLTHDPGWPDRGRWGDYRRKGWIRRPVQAPTTEAGWIRLRDRAEAELEQMRGEHE